MSRYTNTGLAAAEKLFVEAHPRAAQYLDQAPILVMWALPWANWAEKSQQSFATSWIASKCVDGVSLRAFLSASGYTWPMRRLEASAILPSRAGVYRMLARIDPRTLAPLIPEGAKRQRHWLAILHEWLSDAGRLANTERFDSLFQWCATHASALKRDQVRDLLDFQRNADFNPAWGLKRAFEEADLWHRRITLESQLRGLPVGPDERIDLGGHTDRFEVDPYVLTALRTPREIAEEGTAMRHCVATYIRRVFDGASHIVSITRDGNRVATLELAGPKAKATQWRVLQLKGPKNSPVTPAVSALAELFSSVMQDHRKDHAA